MIIAGALLASSSLVLLLQQIPPAQDMVPFQWWIHIAIIALGLFGFAELYFLRKRSTRPSEIYFPWWLIGLGVGVVVIVLATGLSTLLSAPTRFGLGTAAPNGEAISHKSAFERDGRYYLRLNRTLDVEVTREEFLGFEQTIKGTFAGAWVLFSYLVLGLWYYLGKRREELYAG